MFERNTKKIGFTLVELLVVIAIIGILSVVVLVALNAARESARDSSRIRDMNTIGKALELYRIDNARYPDEDSSFAISTAGFEDSNEDNGAFLEPLVAGGYLQDYVLDPINDSEYHYRYYRYAQAAQTGCPGTPDNTNHWCCPEEFFVLGVRKMESLDPGDVHGTSPGAGCGARDWYSNGKFQWVTTKLVEPDN